MNSREGRKMSPRNELWIHPEIQGRGYSTVKQYEDEFVYVSVGSTHATLGRDHEPLISMRLQHTDVTIHGGRQEIKEFKAAKDKRDWVFRTVLNHLSPEWFQYLLNAQYTRGLKTGRNDLRSQLRQLLQEEY